MTWEAWLTLAVLLAMLVVLVREWVPPATAVLGGVIVLLAVEVVDPGQAFAGFSNPAPITVAALFVVARGIEKTGVLSPLVGVALGSDQGDRAVLARLLLPTAGASAFLNNTPIVAMLVPPVARWADRHGRSASKLLMPLSFAAILGGTVTVIGTSTNIVISGLLEASGERPMGFFEIAKLGLPVAVAGVGLLLLVAPRLLPQRSGARRDIEGDVREFVVDMTVSEAGPLNGSTVAEAGLRDLAGVYLVEIDRGDRIIAPVRPDMELRGGDRLRFVGLVSDVADLHNMDGLMPEQTAQSFDTERVSFFEAVLGPSSPVVGRTLKEVGFRSRYQAAVVALHRADQRVAGKLGDLRLRVGDTLLLVATPGFRRRWHDRSDFLLVSGLGLAEPVRSSKGAWSLAIAAGVVLAAATGITSILVASLVGALVTVASGVLSPNEARGAVSLDVVVVIAASFGLGNALVVTGLAERLGDGVVNGLGGYGPVAVLGGVVLATVALTELITNNAAAVLMFPIAVSAAAGVGADPRGFALAVAVAASASFLTPIGYQTNTMVWGPGGYRFLDFARLGLMLTATTVAVLVSLVPVYWSV